MRRLALLTTVAAAALLTACGGGQPRYYVVSIERGPLESLPATCYSSGMVPNVTTTSTNQVDVQTWVVWDGADGKLYLSVGQSTYRLGDSAQIAISGDAIEGTAKEFSTQTTRVVGTTSTTTTSADFSFTDLGDVLKGTMTLTSTTSCSNNCGTPACSVALKVTGRRIQGDPQIIYGGGP